MNLLVINHSESRTPCKYITYLLKNVKYKLYWGNVNADVWFGGDGLWTWKVVSCLDLACGPSCEKLLSLLLSWLTASLFNKQLYSWPFFLDVAWVSWLVTLFPPVVLFLVSVPSLLPLGLPHLWSSVQFSLLAQGPWGLWLLCDLWRVSPEPLTWHLNNSLPFPDHCLSVDDDLIEPKTFCLYLQIHHAFCLENKSCVCCPQ